MGNFSSVANKIFKGVEIATRTVVNGYLALKLAVLGVMNIFGDYEQQIFETTNAISSQSGKIQEAFDRQTDYSKATKSAAASVRGFKIELSDLQDVTNKLGDAQGKLVDKSFDAMNSLTAFKNSITGENSVSEALDKIAVGSMKKFEDSLINGLKNGKLAFKDFADYVIDQLLRVAIQQLVIANIVDPFRNFLGGFDIFNGGKTGGKQAIFEGGGYTGMGARSGGIDGKGGFPAILHPNETVIDHTKGQAMGATVNFNINTVDASGFDELLVSRKGMITAMVNQAMNSRGKVGVV